MNKHLKPLHNLVITYTHTHWLFGLVDHGLWSHNWQGLGRDNALCERGRGLLHLLGHLVLVLIPDALLVARAVARREALPSAMGQLSRVGTVGCCGDAPAASSR